MKQFKILSFLAALLAFAPAAGAAEGKIAIGAQGGWTFPDYHVTSAPTANVYNSRNGWLAGAFLELGIWNITLRPELNYVVKGYNIAHTVDVDNRYIEIPVLVKINPLGYTAISPFLVLGPQWAKRLSSDVTTLGATASYNNTVDRWDLAAVGGIGIDVNITTDIAISAQGRYSWGFRDVDTSSANTRMRGFYAIAGVTFQNMF